MTERKPVGVTVESWVERQIREATERGEFDDLPGAGRPIADLDRPYDDLWWAKQKMCREGLSYLPPALDLRKEAEDALAAVEVAGSEAEARRVLDTVNARIREAIRRPTSGPPVDLVPFDVDRVVAGWRARRSARA